MTPLPESVLTAVLDLARELPPTTLAGLQAELRSAAGVPSWSKLVARLATPAAKERLSRLADALGAASSIDGAEVAVALQSAAYAVAMLDAQERSDIAWTGPSTEAVPMRRVDQVMYELIESASSELLLVTYAAYKAERTLAALRRATERGLRIILVIELAAESGGKIAVDGLVGIRSAVPSAEVFYWPLDKRPKTDTGSYGTMHAKCLIADRRVALVSSANLTSHALELNMELGLVVRGSVPHRLAAHFHQLMAQGDLASVAHP